MGRDHRDKSEAAGNADNDNAELTTPILTIAFVSGVSLVTKALPFQEETIETRTKPLTIPIMTTQN